MTTAVIGATGRVGSEIVRGLLARDGAVVALVRDPDKARRAFGEPDGLDIRPTRLDDPRELAEAFDGIATVFIAMGSIGIEGVLQRIAINAAAGISSIEQVTRLSVLNASPDSLGINQRAHFSIDQFAASTGVPYSTVRPAIFSASLLSATREIRASRTWTGLAGSGHMALIDRPAFCPGTRAGLDQGHGRRALTRSEIATMMDALRQIKLWKLVLVTRRTEYEYLASAVILWDRDLDRYGIGP